jgi:dethiobiotin synthetase
VRTLLVTGTDTGVGKTFVACAIAHALRERGRRVSVMKPIETGVDREPEDAVRLRDAAADTASLDTICPYRFRAPLAPTVAARAENRRVDVARLVRLVRERAAGADVLLIEGAGGLLVPIDGSTTFADLAATCDLPILIVAANRLGTVNHAALTARVAVAAGLTVRGFVLSQPEARTDESGASNAEEIGRLTALPCLGVLGHLSDPASAAPALAVARLL